MKRHVSLLLTLIMLLGMNAVSFAQERTILSLGDSISAGYGLSDRGGECFVSLITLPGDTVLNKAVDGNEAPDIISQLTDPQNENYISPEAVEKSRIVTITCGGNDMMELLYEKIATEYTNVHPRKQKITADEVLGKLAEGNVYAIAAAIHVLDADDEAYYMNDGEFDIRLNTFIENLLWITTYIHSINTEAEIYVATQYNPYVEFENSSGLKVLHFGMEDGTTRLNEAIMENAEKGGYRVCDVKAAFDSYTGDEDLYNANPDLDNINLDFHPSKAGHEVIAAVFDKKINNVHRLGTRNAYGEYELPENVVGYYITDSEGSMQFVDAGIYKANEGDYVEAVYVNTKLMDGAQVKIEGSGIRFLATVDRSEFDAVGYGMVITSEGSDKDVLVDAATWQSDTVFTVAIENIPEENYSRNYTATPFVKVMYDDGTEKVIVGTQSVTRSIHTVARGLLDKGGLDDETKSALQEYINEN